MDTPPSPPPPPHPPLQVSATSKKGTVVSSNPTAQILTGSSMSVTINGSKPINQITKGKKKKKQKHYSQASSASSSSSSTGYCSTASFSHSSTQNIGIRLFRSSRNPKVLFGPGRVKPSDMGSLALPLGMSIAAVVAEVLKRKDTTDENIFVDHLSQICAAAVRESLINVYGDNFGCFVENFEKSFRSTLMTLYNINKSVKANGTGKEQPEIKKCSSEVATVSSSNRAGNCGCGFGVKECQSDPLLETTSSHGQPSTHEVEENIMSDPRNNELIVHDRQIIQQMSFVSPSRSSSEYNRQSILSTWEKSVIEQSRSNDLKTFEMGLTMKKLQLKERELDLCSDANFLERFKLSFGLSKASFRVEKFKTQLEDTRHAELLRKCIDCLVAGLFVMLGCVGYGVFVYSPKRIAEATASCSPMEESKSWWIPKPMASVNSGIQILKCQFQVVTRMLAAGFMVLAIAYLLLQRSATSNQAMPVTFIVLLLAIACGFAGKLCIDTLGGSGNHWLFYWEVLCLLHLLSNLWTSMLFVILHGPINVSEITKNNPRFPYWLRRCLFYGSTCLFLPLLCGFHPFASLGEWKDHFSSLLMDHLLLIED